MSLIKRATRRIANPYVAVSDLEGTIETWMTKIGSPILLLLPIVFSLYHS